MAWFRNHYNCDRCDAEWADEWSCMCDDECPECGLDMTPVESDDLAYLVVGGRGKFSVFLSPATAEHDPEYLLVGESLPSREAALTLAEQRVQTLELLLEGPGPSRGDGHSGL